MKTLLRIAALLAFTGAVGACDLGFRLTSPTEDLDLGGIGELGGSGGTGGFGGSGSVPSSSIGGDVRVGPWAVMTDEAVVTAYHPSDTLSAVHRVDVKSGRYVLRVSGDSAALARVCDYQVQATRWDGERSPLVPLFEPDAGCTWDAVPGEGAGIELPDYEPLTAPFELGGHVRVAGRPPAAGEVGVELRVRDPLDGGADRALDVDADGRWSVQTVDRAEWFWFCAGAQAVVRRGGEVAETRLDPRPVEVCSEAGRTLPDVRFESWKSAFGRVVYETGEGIRLAEAGEARVALVDPGSLQRVAGPAPTLDDGSYHLWLPETFTGPRCELLIELSDDQGRLATRHLLPGGAPCVEELRQDFTVRLDDVPGLPLLQLVVVDPEGDHTGRTDVQRMEMLIDPGTGDYAIDIVAHATDPFQGQLRVNINLYNPDAGSFFYDTVNDLHFGESSTSLRLIGMSDALRSWRSGESVHTNSLHGTPNPPGASLYRSSVAHFPLTYLSNEDVIAFAELSEPALLTEK